MACPGPWHPRRQSFSKFRGELELRIREIIGQPCAELDVELIDGVLSRDHVHMFIAVPPQHALSGLPFPHKRLFLSDQRQYHRRHGASASRQADRRTSHGGFNVKRCLSVHRWPPDWLIRVRAYLSNERPFSRVTSHPVAMFDGCTIIPRARGFWLREAGPFHRSACRCHGSPTRIRRG